MSQSTEKSSLHDTPEQAAKNASANAAHSSMLGDVWNFTRDFGEGLYQGAIENPYNGAAQLTNHIAGTKMPELHLVDSERLSHSAGGVIGNMVGMAADVYVATVATGGVADLVGGTLATGGTAVAATTEAVVGAEAATTAATTLAATGAETTALSAAAGSTTSALTSSMITAGLKFGAIGAAYNGLLQPTDPNSDTFFKDRLENSAVGFATMATMGATGALLDSTGIYATPVVRSLTGNLTYGALTGTTGGLVNSEANALKNGNLVPSLGDVGRDTLGYAAFGMAYGASDFAFNNYFYPPATVDFKADTASFKVTLDTNGQPIQVKGDAPSVSGEPYRVQFDSKLTTTGTWDGTAIATTSRDGGYVGTAVAPEIDQVKIDGNKLILDSQKSTGLIRDAVDGGVFRRFSPSEEAWKAAVAERLRLKPTTPVNASVQNNVKPVIRIPEMGIGAITVPAAKMPIRFQPTSTATDGAIDGKE